MVDHLLCSSGLWSRAQNRSGPVRSPVWIGLGTDLDLFDPVLSVRIGPATAGRSCKMDRSGVADLFCRLDRSCRTDRSDIANESCGAERSCGVDRSRQITPAGQIGLAK